MRLDCHLISGLVALVGVADAFWRLPCRGRSGLARMDPLVSPGEPSYHVHTVHGSNGFAMSADRSSLLSGDCTSCEVKQDKSAYWTPALYFIDKWTGDAELVDEVGGLLVYYLLTGEAVEPFPPGFRMIAGDPFRRNFTLPIPDPPKSEWSGQAITQEALAQKALGFNCLNYSKEGEPSLSRHFLPNKTFLDENCPHGIRFELMFPSCWNGKDVDSHDHKSHMAYPSLVNDGVCPDGFKHRVVSMLFETIWNSFAFKDREGYFAISTGDPTGFGYHGDFMHGWEDGVLEKAVRDCINPSGLVEDCHIFDLQNETQQNLCSFGIPSRLAGEELKQVKGGLPNQLQIEWGPEYAFPIKYVGDDSPRRSSNSRSDVDNALRSLGDIGNTCVAGPKRTSISASNPVPTPKTRPSTEITVMQEIVWVGEQVIITVNEENRPIKTETRSLSVVSVQTLQEH